MQATKVTAPDGTTLAVYESGNAAGPAILFIHGFNQSHLSWARQMADTALAAEFHMVALDLRGHGASGKPLAAEAYLEDRRWGDDIAAVIAAAGLRRPVLVPWSYGGRVTTDYLRAHGAGALAGINFVNATTKSAPEFIGPGGKAASGLVSDDIATNIAATRAFVAACFAERPPQDDMEIILAYNMVVPLHVRRAMMGRSANPGDLLATLNLPVLVTHGSADQLILPAMGQFTTQAVKGARLSLYDGIGHAPFYEDAPRFNRELAAFVRAANGHG